MVYNPNRIYNFCFLGGISLSYIPILSQARGINLPLLIFSFIFVFVSLFCFVLFCCFWVLLFLLSHNESLGCWCAYAVTVVSSTMAWHCIVYYQSICKKVKPPHTRFLVGCRSPFLQLAEHLTALRAWCSRCLPGR